jgi:hypothetical protein
MDAAPRTALLYVSNGDGIVNVYRYSKGTLVGELTDFSQPKGECTDGSGNVYITDYGRGKIVEYAHGAKTPLRRIDDFPYRPYGCAVNPRNGDLAVANYSSVTTYSHQGNLAVFVHAKGQPKYYSNTSLYNVNACAYDKYGDLLAAGFFTESSYYVSGYFGYLAAGSSDFETIDLPSPTTCCGWSEVPGVAWDGEYFTVESYRAIDQYSINIKPALIGTVQLDEGEGPVAFYPPNSKQQATQAVGTGNSENDVFYWDYPTGGAPIATIAHGLARPFGVAISIPK